MLYLEPQAAAGSKISVTTTATKLFDLINTAASTTAARAGYSDTANGIDFHPEDGDVRVIFAEGVTPTTSNGFLLKQGVTYFFRNVPLSKMKLISTSGTVACSLSVGACSQYENTSASLTITA